MCLLSCHWTLLRWSFFSLNFLPQGLLDIEKIPQAFSFSGWRIRAILALSHEKDSPVPSTPLWPFAGVSSAGSCLSYNRKLEQNTRRDFTSVLQKGRITSSPNGNALVNAAQDTVGLFLCEAALLAHDHLVVNHDHEMRLCRAAYQHVLVHGIVLL